MNLYNLDQQIDLTSDRMFYFDEGQELMARLRAKNLTFPLM